MYIQRIPPKKFFTMVDRKVLTHKKLSDGAKLLYCFLFGLPPSTNYSDGYLMKVMDLSQRSITSRKRELKKADLLLTEQIGARVYHAYMGTLDLPASKVMEIMKAKDMV